MGYSKQLVHEVQLYKLQSQKNMYTHHVNMSIVALIYFIVEHITQQNKLQKLALCARG